VLVLVLGRVLSQAPTAPNK